MKVTAYTDASFCHYTKYATCGFVVVRDGKTIQHEVTFVKDAASITNLERQAIISALQYCFLLNGVSKIVIKTDHIAFAKREKNKKRFEELELTLEIIKEHGIKVWIDYIKSHSGNRYHDLIDESCRYHLKRFKQNEVAFILFNNLKQ